MTFDEKLEALKEHCDLHNGCDTCRLYMADAICPYERLMSFNDVEKAYALVFGVEESTPVIKDSGERREFATGAVRDMAEGKGRMDLMPWAAILEVSKHCENGAKKYGEHNIDKGLPTSSLCDSAARHLAKYLDGWADEPHLLAAAWNLLWAIQMTVKCPEMVDTPWRGDAK